MNTKNSARSWLRVALLNFLLAAVLGLVLRAQFVWELPGIIFRPVMHAHSHVAMLGWVCMALLLLLHHHFSVADVVTTRLLYLMQGAVLGMLVSFAAQGYGPVSILCSALHAVSAVCLALRIWPKLNLPQAQANGMGLFVKTGFVFMLISLLGALNLGPAVMLKAKGTAFYYLAIQFFLHFQFNGWFLFASLGLFFGWLAMRGIQLKAKLLWHFYLLLTLSCVLTYALAIAWAEPVWWVFGINTLGALVQLGAGVLLLRMLWPNRQAIAAHMPTLSYSILLLGLSSVLFKIVVQTAVAVPQVAVFAFTLRMYVIGFIHLTMLGAITMLILSLASTARLLPMDTPAFRRGHASLLAGFVGSELLLFGQGTAIAVGWGYWAQFHLALFGVSALLPLGVLGMLLAQRRQTGAIA